MGGEPPIICSACGYALGDPNNEVVAAGNEDENPDAHFVMQKRDDGEERLQCRSTGRLASAVGPGDDDIGGDDLSYPEVFQEHHGELPPGMGEGGRPEGNNSEPAQRPEPEPEGIYDVDEEKTQLDLVNEVVTNPRYGLNDDHIQEVREWAADMDGRLPPQTLEDILKNLKGVQKQSAELIRQRYELKLNKWMREQSQDDHGPPIGVSTQPMPGQRGSPNPSPTPTPTPSPKKKSPKSSPDDPTPDTPDRPPRERQREGADNLREFRRTRRTKRRQDVLDTTMERAAEQAADEIARELVTDFGRYFSLPAKIIEAKIEKDPDWALEKAEELDIDIMSFLEPSEQRKEEIDDGGRGSGPQVDNEIDDALQQVKGGGSTRQEQQQQEELHEQNMRAMEDQPEMDEQVETPKSIPPNGQDAPNMSAAPEDDLDTESEAVDDPQDEEEERIGEELFE